MAWIIANKLEMTRIIKNDSFIPITLLKVPELKIFWFKTLEKDWYEAMIVWVLKTKWKEKTETYVKKEIELNKKIEPKNEWEWEIKNDSKKKEEVNEEKNEKIEVKEKSETKEENKIKKETIKENKTKSETNAKQENEIKQEKSTKNEWKDKNLSENSNKLQENSKNNEKKAWNIAKEVWNDTKIETSKQWKSKKWNTTLSKCDFVVLKEFKTTKEEIEKYKVWDNIDIDLIQDWMEVKIEWISKWKWFTWAMKRHNFHWWPAGHGSKFHRALWSTGNRKPTRTHKWKKMHWHLGDSRVSFRLVKIELVNKEVWVIWVRWWVPWWRNSAVNLTFSVEK